LSETSANLVNMTKIHALARTALVLASFCALRAAADVVVTTNGARIVGKITSIGDGTIVVATDYAGEIKVKQGLVSSIETDRPVAVRLANGERVIGIVTPADQGRLRIAGSNSETYATMQQVAASWAAGEEDPLIVAQRRKWSYVVGVDINGETGTDNQVGTNLLFKATLKGPVDDLQLYTNYNRQVTNGEKSVDQFKAGVDYADNFSDGKSWYVRDEAGFDREDTAAFGFGYDFTKTANQQLTGRVGLSYRDYRYSDEAGTPALSAVGGDLELEYMRKFWRSELHDKVTFLPDFQDTSNYVITHDLHYSVPLTASLWKLGMGVTNSYDSKPVAGVSKIETLYYTRLELTWKQK
jgi:hypothetical protein